MLGRLTRWLRMLGYDTHYDPRLSDPQMVRLARAEDRLLLTRDTQLALRRGVRVLVLASERLEEQLAQLQRDVGLSPQMASARCPLCNEPLEAIPRDWAWGQVPPYVFATQQAFELCPACNRLYWRGSHYRRICERLARLDSR